MLGFCIIGYFCSSNTKKTCSVIQGQNVKKDQAKDQADGGSENSDNDEDEENGSASKPANPQDQAEDEQAKQNKNSGTCIQNYPQESNRC